MELLSSIHEKSFKNGRQVASLPCNIVIAVLQEMNNRIGGKHVSYPQCVAQRHKSAYKDLISTL